MIKAVSRLSPGLAADNLAGRLCCCSDEYAEQQSRGYCG